MGPLASVPTEATAWVARTVLGVTFLVSGAAKLRDVPAFTLAVDDYGILPSRLVGPVAHVVPLADLEDTVDGIGHRLSSDSIVPRDEGSGDDG